MAWIYLAESEDSPKRWKVMSSHSPIVKTTDMLNQFCYLAWVLEIYHEHRSGTMCERLNPKCFPPSTLSTAVSPAKTFPWLAAEKAWEESVQDYSSRSLGLSAKYNPDSSSWRTSQRLLFEEQNELLESFAAYGMTVDGEFYPLRMWARITKGKGGGYLPTPRETDGSGGAAKLRVQGALGLNEKRFQLREWAKAFPTPRANERGQYQRDRGIKGKERPTLTGIAKMWPTPKARDRYPEGLEAAKKRHTPNLSSEVIFRTLQATDGKNRGTTEYRKGKQIQLQTQVGGQLNPTWVELLMGFPLGWTDTT